MRVQVGQVGQVYRDCFGDRYTIKEVDEERNSCRVEITGPLKHLYTADEDGLFGFSNSDDCFAEATLVTPTSR